MVPAIQATQVPPLHTRFIPHDIPSAIDTFVSVHDGVPEAQLRLPLWQTFDGMQPCPSLQTAQVPVLVHTIPMPHLAPGALFAPSVHVDVPEEHDVDPSLHGFVG